MYFSDHKMKLLAKNIEYPENNYLFNRIQDIFLKRNRRAKKINEPYKNHTINKVSLHVVYEF